MRFSTTAVVSLAVTAASILAAPVFSTEDPVLDTRGGFGKAVEGAAKHVEKHHHAYKALGKAANGAYQALNARSGYKFRTPLYRDEDGLPIDSEQTFDARSGYKSRTPVYRNEEGLSSSSLIDRNWGEGDMDWLDRRELDVDDEAFLNGRGKHELDFHRIYHKREVQDVVGSLDKRNLADNTVIVMARELDLGDEVSLDARGKHELDFSKIYHKRDVEDRLAELGERDLLDEAGALVVRETEFIARSDLDDPLELEPLGAREINQDANAQLELRAISNDEQRLEARQRTAYPRVRLGKALNFGTKLAKYKAKQAFRKAGSMVKAVIPHRRESDS